MRQETLVRANYRITKDQDKWVKKWAKKNKRSEAEIIRHLITGQAGLPVENLNLEQVKYANK